MMHHGHAAIDKMGKAAEAFRWPGMYREIQEKSENCPSCRAAGKNLRTQLSITEVNRLEILTEPNQEIQLDFAGPIKLKTRGDVYILVAVDRFSKCPTAHICKNTDTRTVMKFLTKLLSDNGTPQTIRTDNGSCFKSHEFKQFCAGEKIKRIRCTPNLHTGTGFVERTLRTIKSLTRAKLEDGLTFEESVQLAIKTIRQTSHSKLNMTPFQLYFGRKPRMAITNMIGQPSCLLSNWKKTVTKYISAQMSELQVLTIHDSDGEMADYLVLNENEKRPRSVSQNFKQYQFYEKEDNPNPMKCRFEVNKTLTDVRETGHTITTADEKTVHKKLASNPLKIQPPQKPEESRKSTSRCRRCGKFSQGDFCETHKRLISEKLVKDEASTSKSFPKIPNRDAEEERTVITITKDIQTDNSEGDSNAADEHPEADEIPEIDAPPPTTATGHTLTAETPMPSSPIGCSTGIGTRINGWNPTATPTKSSDTTVEPSEEGRVYGKGEGCVETTKGTDKVFRKSPKESLEVRRSNRIKTAKRVEKMGT